MLMEFTIAQDLDLHSASEDDHEAELMQAGDQSEEEELQEPESPVVLKTMVGFVRNSSPAPPEVKSVDDSVTGTHYRC